MAEVRARVRVRVRVRVMAKVRLRVRVRASEIETEISFRENVSFRDKFDIYDISVCTFGDEKRCNADNKLARLQMLQTASLKLPKTRGKQIN